MEPNKILSANLLDLIFDERNKEYGAYELRKTYARRVTKSLLITGSVAVLVFAGTVLANSMKNPGKPVFAIKTVDLTAIDQIKEPEPIPEPRKPEPQPQTRTEKLTEFKVVPNDQVDEPPPTQDDLKTGKISDIKVDGLDDKPLAEPVVEDRKGIIETKKEEPARPASFVEIEAKFTGNWEKFLRNNLNAEIPIDNGAPAGRYTVYIQFVVDLDGSVSDIQPLTNIGFGMEKEAVRVLKKAAKWEPAVQNGHYVKAYRKQPITFVVEEQ